MCWSINICGGKFWAGQALITYKWMLSGKHARLPLKH